MRFDDRANSLAYDLVVIGNQNPKICHPQPCIVADIWST
jgi:hypothetical protein